MRTQNGKEASKPDAVMERMCAVRTQSDSVVHQTVTASYKWRALCQNFQPRSPPDLFNVNAFLQNTLFFASARDCRKNIAHFCHVIAHKLHEICDEQQNRTFIRIFNCRAFTDSSGGFIIAQRLNCKKNRKLAMCLFCCEKCD